MLTQDHKRLLLLLTWFGAVAFHLYDNNWLSWIASGALSLYITSALLSARRETLVVLAIIVGLSLLLLLSGGQTVDIIRGIERTLIFAALLPTLQLVRATIRRLPAMNLSQRRFSSLAPRQANIGILFGSQALGAVLNTGAFAFMAATISENAQPEKRLAAAQASLRGMNIAVLWSPFFVGFAVASTYLPAVPLWQIMPLGIFFVGCGLGLALLIFARPLSPAGIFAAMHCLRPIAPYIAFAASAVIVCAFFSTLSTLSTVLLIMPLLCFSQWLLRPQTALPILSETYRSLDRMGDDMLIITAAMILGTVAENAPLIADHLAPWLAGALPQPLIIGAVVFLMTGCGVIGIHPMISGTVIMLSLSGHAQQVSDLVLMEAMLVGWGLASMISISSLSTITAGAMYRVPPLRLAFGPNMFFVLCFGLFVILLLSAIDTMLL